MQPWLRRHTGVLMAALLILTIAVNVVPADTIAAIKSSSSRPLLSLVAVSWGALLFAAWLGALADYKVRKQDASPPASMWYVALYGLFIFGAAMYYLAVMQPANRRDGARAGA